MARKSTKAERVELLGRVPLFSECSKRELGRIADCATEERVASGTVLTKEGEPGDRFFVLAEGLAEATVKGRKVGSIKPGSFFGEMALLDRGPRTATVKVELPSRLLIVTEKDFKSLIFENPGVVRKMLRVLAERL